MAALSDTSDADIVGAMAAGRPDALAELYRRYGGLMMAIGLRLLKDKREAEDLLHDVFVEAWRKASGFDADRGGVRAWLVTRTRSRALDRIKSPGRARATSLDNAGPEPSAPEASADDHARVRAHLDALSDDHRAVVELAYFEGLSSSEIAAKLEIPIGTVKSRMAAALSRLRVTMGAL